MWVNESALYASRENMGRAVSAFQSHIAVTPPSMTNSAPVTKAASSEAR